MAAFTRLGLETILTFNEASAVTAMGRASNAFIGLKKASGNAAQTVVVSEAKLRRMSQSSRMLAGNLQRASRAFTTIGSVASRAGSVVSRAGVAITNVGRSIGFAALAATPLTLALKKGFTAASDFESAMAGVIAVNPTVTEGMDKLKEKAIDVAAETRFTGTEMLDAFQVMRRASLTVPETLALARPAADLAAAANMDLADSTRSLVKAMKGLGVPMTDATKLVDQLGMASTASTADLGQLSTSLSYAVGGIRDLGIDRADALGALSAISMTLKEGSRAGTSFNAFLSQLAKKSKNGAIQVGKQSVALVKLADGSLDLYPTVLKLNAAFESQFGPIERAAQASSLFNERAKRAWTALTKNLNVYKDAMDKVKNVQEGFAQLMAKARLDTFSGQIILLKSALEKFAVVVFGPIVEGPLKKLATSVFDFVKDVATAITVMRKMQNSLGNDDEVNKLSQQWRNFSGVVQNVASGIMDAFDDISSTIKSVVSTGKVWLRAIFGPLTEDGSQLVKTLVKIGVKLLFYAGVLAPVAAVVSVLTIAFGTMISALGSFIAAFAILKVLGPILLGAFLIPFIKIIAIAALVIGGLVMAFKSIRREGESVSDVFKRLWDDYLSPVVEGIKTGLAPGLRLAGEAFKFVGRVADVVLASIADMFSPILGSMSASKDGLEYLGIGIGILGSVVVGFISSFIAGFSELLGFLIIALSTIGKYVIEHIVNTIKLATYYVSELVNGFRDLFSGKILDGLYQIGKTMIRVLISPFSDFIKMLFTAAEAVLGIKIPNEIKSFVESPQLDFPEKKKEDALGAAVEKGFEKANFKEFKLKAVVEDKRDLKIENCLNIDGKTLHRSMSKISKELADRADAGANRYQNRLYAEHGAEVRKV